MGQKHDGDFSDPWEMALARFRQRKFKELVERWQNDRKEKNLPWSLSDLGEEIGWHRNTLSAYLNGKREMDLQTICRFFQVDPKYFVPTLGEMDIVNEQHHKMMQAVAAEAAQRNHVSEGFLWFLKSDSDLQHEILRNQRTDAILNSFDPDVPDVKSPYQFELKTGKRAYLNEDSMIIIGMIEKEVKNFTSYQIWKNYNDMEETNAILVEGGEKHI